MRFVAVEACVGNLNDRSRLSSDSVVCLKSLLLIFSFLSLFLPFSVVLDICVVDTGVENASVFVVVVENFDTGEIGREIADIDVATVDDDVMAVWGVFISLFLTSSTNMFLCLNSTGVLVFDELDEFSIPVGDDVFLF